MNKYTLSRDIILSRPILFWGGARSIKSAYKLLDFLGHQSLYLVGLDLPDWFEDKNSFYPQENKQRLLELGQEIKPIVVLSPGLDPRLEIVKKVCSNAFAVVSEVELATYFIKAPLIGVTGSNGKSSTCSFLHQILLGQGLACALGGNIGHPLSEIALDSVKGKRHDAVVVELSSFQLEQMSHKVWRLGAILNLTPSHGERYDKISEYYKAKWNLLNVLSVDQGKFLFPDFAAIDPSEHEQCERLEKASSVRLLSPRSWSEWKSFFSIPGEHNWYNLSAALDLANDFNTLDIKKLECTIKELSSLEHRLERVLEPFGEFLVYNDTKSTNFKSTIMALKAMDWNKPIVLMMGGQLRGNEIIPAELRGLIQKHASVVYTFGEARNFLAENLGFEVVCLEALEDCLSHLRSTSSLKEAQLLFSPGHPSFDAYKNFELRGIHFKELIKKDYL